MKEYKDIKGFEKLYQVSNFGDVYTKPRSIDMGKYIKAHDGYKKTHQVLPSGYCQVNLWKNNKQKQMYIHRLVAIAFIPNPLNYKEVNHKNGIKTDNKVENLEWCSSIQNKLHAKKNGLTPCFKGSNNPMAKLTDLDVLEIRKKHISCKYSVKKLSKEYSVSLGTIYNIINNRNWIN